MKMVLVCHLQHAVALLLYASLTADVKLTERLFWTTTQMKRVYWPVRREAPWSVWRSSSPRPGGQTLQTLSGVRYETARPLDQQNTPQTALIERPVKKPVCVCDVQRSQTHSSAWPGWSTTGGFWVSPALSGTNLQTAYKTHTGLIFHIHNDSHCLCISRQTSSNRWRQAWDLHSRLSSRHTCMIILGYSLLGSCVIFSQLVGFFAHNNWWK